MIKGHEHHLTVGDLLKFIKNNNIPDHAPVFMQRVEDVYFEKHGWTTENMPGFHYRQPEYSMEDPAAHIASQEDLNQMMEKYYQAWCPVFYKDEPEVLFLDAHY